MFWTNKLEFWEVCPGWTFEEVKGMQGKYPAISTIPYDTFEGRWAVFGYILGASNGLDEITASSMMYFISVFMGDMGISAATDVYFDEEAIDFAILDELNSLDDDLSEKDAKQHLIKFILDLFKNDLRKYEYAHLRYDFRIGVSDSERLKNVPGKTRKEKFINLLDFWEENRI